MVKNLLTLIHHNRIPTIMINHLDMVGEHVQLGVVQFRRLLFDFLQGGGLLACVCVTTGANDIRILRQLNTLF